MAQHKREPTGASGHTPSTPPKPASSSFSPIGWRNLHLWEIQPVRDTLLVAAVLGLVYLGHWRCAVTVPLLLALALAYLLEPIVGWLNRRWRLSRQAAAVVLIVAMAIVVIVPAVFAAAFSIVQAMKLSVALPIYWEKVQPQIVEMLDHFGISSDPETIKSAVTDWLLQNSHQAAGAAGNTVDSALRVVFRVLTASFYVAFMLFIVPFFFYFFSSSYPRVREFAGALIPHKHRARTLELVHRMDVVVSGFVRGRIVIAFCLGVFHAIGWTLCGVPASVLVGLAAGLFSIIPFAIVVTWPVAIALLWLDQNQAAHPMVMWQILLWPTVVYLLGQVLENYILMPIIQGKATNLDAATIVASVLAGASVAGAYGALLALPVAACLKILMVEVIMPRFRAWTQGRAADPLPLGDVIEQKEQ